MSNTLVTAAATEGSDVAYAIIVGIITVALTLLLILLIVDRHRREAREAFRSKLGHEVVQLPHRGQR